MKINRSFFILMIAISVIALFTACKEEPNSNAPEQKVLTPTIRGSVSIPKGSGLSGSDFYIRVMDGDRAVYTGKANDDGSFSVAGLKEETLYKILVTTAEPGNISENSKDITDSKQTETSGYGGWLTDVVASVDEQSNVGQVAVKPLGTIRGVVTKTGSEDGYDVMVYIPGTSYMAITDEDGNFSIFNIPQETYRLRITSSGYIARMIEDVVLYSEDDSSPVRTINEIILIRNTGSIEGFAVRDGEIDNSGITIRLEQEGSTVNLSASTAINGYFKIDNITPGKYRILASYSGYLTHASDYYDVVPARLTSIADRIELAQNIGTVRGSVSLSDSTVKGGISITITGLDSERNYSAVTTEDGNFNRNVSAGSYRVTAYYPGYSSKNVEVTVFQGTSVDAEIGALSISSGIVTGRVVLDGVFDDYSGIVVTLTSTADSNDRYSTFTDIQGSYTISGISKACDYTLECSKNGFVKNTAVLVSVSRGVTNEVSTITLKNLTSKVSGTISLEGTKDFTGISVLLKATDNSVQYDATTDQNGEFIMSKVVPGEYNLIVSKAGYVSKTVEGINVEVATSKTLDAVFLNIGTRSVTGSLTLELRSDYAGALVTATNLSDSRTVYSAITNSSGTFTLAGMKPGEYSITLSCAGYNTVTLPTVNVIDGSEKTLDAYQLHIARGTILGTALLEGRGSNAGVKAELMKGAEVYATTITDDSGLYLFSVPQGNYSGVRLSCDNFKSVSIVQSIALIANDFVTIGEEGSSTQMISTHVPIVKGRLTVKGLLSLDYSDIHVTLIENGMTTTTDKDGYWSFFKVPVGNYTLKFERENTSIVTKAIDVVAAAEKNVEMIELIPNAASIEGHVTLSGKTDHSGITVRATAEGMVELSTKTNAAGYFYLGNVVTTETYTVHFEKDGWVSQTTQVSGLENLSLNDITEANPVNLIDTTNPILNSISVVVGNSEMEGRKLNVYFESSDAGSGLCKVYVNTSNDFTGIEAQNYSNPFLCFVDDMEGDYTLFVKVADDSGNESEVVSQSYRIADYKTTVSSVLIDNEDGANDGIIRWTKNRSPYYVTGNILVDDNTTLIIESGVNVQFSGAYYIQVEGIIRINGTKNEKVYLYGVGAGEDTWTGIRGMKDNGNTISNTNLTGMARGLSGYMTISDTQITATSNGTALSGFKGIVENSSITGGIGISDSIVKSSKFIVQRDSSSISSSQISACSFDGTALNISDSTLDSDTLSSLTLKLSNVSSVSTTISNCTLTIEHGLIYKSELNGCTFSLFSYGTIRDSNIIDCGILATKTKKSSVEQISLRNNYWGVNNTAELNANGVNSNLSFIRDYYDDFNVTKADLTGYKTTAITDAGFVGVETTAAQYSIGDTGPAGGIVFYDKGYYSDGWRYLEAASSDIDNECYYVFGYYKKSDDGSILHSGTSYGIGFGKLNTQILVEDMGDSAYTSSDGPDKTENYAARLCDIYSYGGFSDWFLPSRDELNLLYINLNKAGLGGFANYYDGYYWSSSEGLNSSDSALSQYFYDGTQFNDARSLISRVRPIRSF